MYPEQNPDEFQPANQTGVDYLEQISAKPTTPKLQFLNKKIMMLLVIVGIMIIAVIVLAAISNNNAKSPNSTILSARMNGLVTIIKFGEQNELNDAPLEKTLAETSLATTSNNNLLKPIMTTPDKNSTAAEPVDDIIKSLETAKSAGNFSQQYAIALSSQLDRIEQTLATIASETNNNTNRSIAKKALVDINELQARLSTD